MIVIRWGEDRPHCGHDSPLGGRVVGRRLASERRAVHHMVDQLCALADLIDKPLPRPPDDGWVPLPVSPTYRHPGHDVRMGCIYEPVVPASMFDEVDDV